MPTSIFLWPENVLKNYHVLSAHSSSLYIIVFLEIMFGFSFFPIYFFKRLSVLMNNKLLGWNKLKYPVLFVDNMGSSLLASVKRPEGNS